MAWRLIERFGLANRRRNSRISSQRIGLGSRPVVSGEVVNGVIEGPEDDSALLSFRRIWILH